MAATRLLKMSKPLGLARSHENNAISSMVSRSRIVLMSLNKVGISSENPPGGGVGGSERKTVAVKAAGCTLPSMLVSEPSVDKRRELSLLLAYIADAMSHLRKLIAKQLSCGFNLQVFVEKAIIDCRFFTLLAVAGSLLSSVLCFLEGCFLILGSYLKYFQSLSEQGRVVFQLIEAIDMFIMGTAMLVFAMALHVMFVGQNNVISKGSHHSPSTLKLKVSDAVQRLPSWIERETAVQAKSKIGHAVIMILQIQVLDKLKTIPVTNAMDLSCFAGAIFLSSASIFVLSRISVARAEVKKSGEEMYNVA